MSRKTLFFPLLVLMALFLVLVGGCSQQSVPPGEVPIDTGEKPTDSEIIAAWIENSQSMFLAQSRELGGTQYFLVTYGMKDSAGYAVEITNVEVLSDRVSVTVKFTALAPGQAANGVETTNPYAMEEIPATGLPAEFIATGDEVHVPQLLDLDYLKPIVVPAPSSLPRGIKIFSPSPESIVERQFSVEGVANVFEGNIQYRLTDEKGKVLISGIATASMGDWKYFSLNLTVDNTVPIKGSILLELYTESPKDGSTQDLVQINLTLKD